MKKEVNFIIDILVRYSTLIVVGLLSNTIFYMFFTALTLYPVYFLLSLFHDVSVVSNLIIINNLPLEPIEIIGSCVAGSAYFLLMILNLSTRGIKIKKRIGILFLSFGLLLSVNILRIFILSLMFISQKASFDITHQIFWYLGSTVFVVGIWFLCVKIFGIKEIPFYSDIKFLLKNSKKTIKHTKSSKKN